MPGRVCTLCTHPERKKIDRILAFGSASLRSIERRYGLSHGVSYRHMKRCLDPRLIAAAERSLEAEILSAREIAAETVMELREDKKATRGVHAEQYLGVVDRLIKANDQHARIRKEINADPVNALFIQFGVRDEAELKSRLAVTKGLDAVEPEQVQEEAIAALEKVWHQRPELREDAMRKLERTSYALEVSTNGHSEPA